MTVGSSQHTPGDWDATIQDISNWMLSRILGVIDLKEILDGVSELLVEAGVPLIRSHMGMNTLHPMYQASTFTWRAGDAGDIDNIPYVEAPSQQWLASPIRPLVEEGLMEVRYCLEGDGEWRDYPMLVDLRKQGATEYIAMATQFQAIDRPQARIDGLVSSWTTSRPGGFTPDEFSALERLQLRLAAAAKAHKGEQTARNILTAYLGGDAARRVLDGQIRRGDGDVIPCVIWYSDLRGSTALAEALAGPEFLSALNVYFECTAGAVMAGGGDVLRFIGDAVLAIFPIGDGYFDSSSACQAALDAAWQADVNLAEANGERRDMGQPELAFGLGLHIGEVLFGNIGTPDRVEFSVIGPTANEVARIEAMTKELAQTILVSGAFADHLDGPWMHCGNHPLRGVGADMRLFAPVRP